MNILNQEAITAIGSGGISFVISTIFSLFSKMMDHSNSFRLVALNSSIDVYKLSVKDIQSARKYDFKFARRLIVFSLFILPVVFLFICSILSIDNYIPFSKTYSYIFGLFKGNTVILKHIHGFYLMRIMILDIAPMCAGFYFGSKYKD